MNRNMCDNPPGGWGRTCLKRRLCQMLNSLPCLLIIYSLVTPEPTAFLSSPLHYETVNYFHSSFFIASPFSLALKESWYPTIPLLETMEFSLSLLRQPGCSLEESWPFLLLDREIQQEGQACSNKHVMVIAKGKKCLETAKKHWSEEV